MKFFFKVHLACYFWNICNNKRPLGKQVRVEKGSDFEPKLPITVNYINKRYGNTGHYLLLYLTINISGHLFELPLFITDKKNLRATQGTCHHFIGVSVICNVVKIKCDIGFYSLQCATPRAENPVCF